MTRGATESDVRLLDLIRDRLSIEIADVDVDLIGTGAVDSLGLVMLIAALEESFACELPLDDFDIDNFRSVRRIGEYLGASGVLAGRDPCDGEAS